MSKRMILIACVALTGCTSPTRVREVTGDGAVSSTSTDAASTSTDAPATVSPPKAVVSDAAPVPLADSGSDASRAMPATVLDAGYDSGSDSDSGVPYRLNWTTTVAPGVEKLIYTVAGPAFTEEKWITAWHSKIKFAHHVNFWIVPAGRSLPVGIVSSENLTGYVFVFDASQSEYSSAAPAGGAIRVPAGATPFDVHELNTTSDVATLTVDVELNLSDRQPGPEIFSTYLNATNFSVPADTMQTLSWSCPFPDGASIVWLCSHTHAMTTLFTILADGAEVYRSETWAEPVQKVITPPLSPKTIGWTTTIVNKTPSPVKYGYHRDTDEMSAVYLMTTGKAVTCER